jgi:hypothetical protein
MLGFNGGLLGLRREQKRTTPGLWFPNERAVIEGSDPYWDNVSLLLHMDGSNGSTTFTDSSRNANALTVTANGNAQISTAQSKFGGASALFDGTGDYLSIASNPVFAFPGDFTIEAWIYPLNLQLAGIFGTYVSFEGFIVYLGSSGMIGIQTQTNYKESSGSVYTANEWQHIALVKSETNTYKIFRNGSEVSLTVSEGTLASSFAQRAFNVGVYDTTQYFFNGYIDDLRITKGVARYTANFTPPTAPFPNA